MNTPRLSVKVLLLATLASVALTASTVIAAEPAKRPNLVVILADDLGWGSVGCYGGTRLQTPNIDRLARQGRMFRHAYATGSVCSPTRYALMTGRYYWRTSVKDGQVLPGNSPLHIETNRLTLASLAKANGYHTAAIGKWHLGLGLAARTDWNSELKPGPLSVGFDYFFGLAANLGNQPNGYIENEQLIGRAPGERVTLEGEGKTGKTLGLQVQRVAEEVTPKLTGKATEWIEKNRGNRFFLYFAPNVIHEPIVPTAQFSGSPYGKYGDFITEMDWAVGRILETLDKLKLTEETVVLFTSDNGGVVNPGNENASAAIKSGLAINGSLRGGKHDIWEGGFREPFIVRWPGKVPAGTSSDQMVAMPDVLGTFAAILGTPLPKGQAEDSFDVSAAWLGKSASNASRDFVVLQDASANYALRQGPWKLVERENAPAFEARNRKAAQKRERAAKAAAGGDELYNLLEDPGETKNVAAQNPEVVRKLRQLLTRAREQSGTRL
jgi:arylsulfatase A-like enzyme